MPLQPEHTPWHKTWLNLGPGWLFASIRDAVVVVSAESGEIALWNPAAVELFGYSPSEVLGRPLPELIFGLEHPREWALALAGTP